MRRPNVPLLVLGLSGLLLLVAGWLFWSSPRAQAQRERAAKLAAAREAGVQPAVASGPAGPEPAPVGLRVDAYAVRLRPAHTTTELAAVLAPIRSVQLAAEVDGRVVEVAVEEHETVDAGETLIRLERTLLGASVERARGSLLRAEASHRLAQLELARQRDLAARQVASTADLDRAESQERTSFATLLEARAALTDARTRLAKTDVQAPFAGEVTDLDLEPGAYLRVGQPVARILDLSSIEVEVGVTDREVVALRVGDAAGLRVDVFADEEFEGTIAHIGRAADERTQKYPVQIRVPNPQGRLLAGMLGRVRFDLEAGEPTIRIPRRATQTEFGLDYVFVLEGGRVRGTAHRRRVATRPVPFRPDLLEVISGLREGERIAVSGVRELRDGLEVGITGDDL